LTGEQEASDQELVARTLHGDKGAFDLLINRHGGRLYQFAARHVPDPDDSYDVVQEAFISAWEALRRYDPGRPFDVWLRSILFNKCRDRARRAAVRRIIVRFTTGDAIEGMADPGPTVESRLSSAAALDRFEQALERLPRHLRQALVLTQWDGLSHKEAAQLLGVSPKQVENRVYLAKQKLAAQVEPSDLQDLIDGS
jgi:RNA polymerase sigma factor CnrH